LARFAKTAGTGGATTRTDAHARSPSWRRNSGFSRTLRRTRMAGHGLTGIWRSKRQICAGNAQGRQVARRRRRRWTPGRGSQEDREASSPAHSQRANAETFRRYIGAQYGRATFSKRMTIESSSRRYRLAPPMPRAARSSHSSLSASAARARWVVSHRVYAVVQAAACAANDSSSSGLGDSTTLNAKGGRRPPCDRER
jgi:hypothetical protein